MGFLGTSLLGAAGSLFGGLFGGMASGQATAQYVKALKQAQNYLQGQTTQGLQAYQPYQGTGAQATKTLADLTGTPGQGLLTPWTQQFTAPTAAQAAQTPGYQFQLQQGENAIQNSAAGKGSLLTGRTMADLNNYAQGTAASNYQNVFQNALTQYQNAYQTFLNNQNNTYSRLLGLSGQGLQATGEAGQFRAGMGGDIASLYGQQGAAQAQGTMAQANAYGGILPGVSSNLMQGYLLSSLLGNQASPSGGYGNFVPGGPSGILPPVAPTAASGVFGTVPQ